jgi:RNA 2',3'-cyclic 3'-phosphodiesterase
MSRPAAGPPAGRGPRRPGRGGPGRGGAGRAGRGADPARPASGRGADAARSASGRVDPSVADPDLLAGRLFFAVPVPGVSRAPLEAALPDLAPLLGGARLTASGGWHLTLAFLGQVRPELADAVVRVGEAAAAGVPAARLRLEGSGAFPNGRRARVLWAGIGGDTDVLVRLAASLAAECKAAGLRFEERPLVPHLTLARFSTPAPVPEAALELVAGAAAAGSEWEARELACYRSILGGSRGARYRVIREFPLAG